MIFDCSQFSKFVSTTALISAQTEYYNEISNSRSNDISFSHQFFEFEASPLESTLSLLCSHYIFFCHSPMLSIALLYLCGAVFFAKYFFLF